MTILYIYSFNYFIYLFIVFNKTKYWCKYMFILKDLGSYYVAPYRLSMKTRRKLFCNNLKPEIAFISVVCIRREGQMFSIRGKWFYPFYPGSIYWRQFPIHVNFQSMFYQIEWCTTTSEPCQWNGNLWYILSGGSERHLSFCYFAIASDQRRSFLRTTDDFSWCTI